MAYIATKATYIREEEVKDENGKPAVDTNGKPIKRIVTDADDIVFEAGEVIVLVEKINDGKHFDLEIEDKGSTYFAPTQIKIGDGVHSFGELNWLQTIDDFKVQSTIDKKIATYKTNVDKTYETFTNSINAKIGEQNNLINDFVNYQSKEILRDLVQDNYFSISSNGVLSAFSGTEVPTVNNLKSFSIGNYNTFYNKATEQMGRYCAVFGNNHNMFGFNNYSFGYNNSIDGAYILAHGFQNVINTSKDNKWTVCFGHKNQINNADSSIVIGKGNIVEYDNSVVIGTNNRTKNTDSFIFGSSNKAEYRGVVFGNNSHAGMYSICCGQQCNSSQANVGLPLGQWSACFGNSCYTGGKFSFACGNRTEAITDNSFACGVYNDGNNKIFSVGNGIDGDRSNIFDIDTSGKATFYGDLEVKGDISYKDISILPTNNNISTVFIDKNTSKNIFLKDNSQAYTLHFVFAANKKYLLGIFYDSTNLTINTSAFTIVKNYEKTINNYTICSVDATASSNPTILFTNNTTEMQKIRVEFYEIS